MFTKISKLFEAFALKKKALNESKYSMPWVRCAFGIVLSIFVMKDMFPRKAQEPLCRQSVFLSYGRPRIGSVGCASGYSVANNQRCHSHKR